MRRTAFPLLLLSLALGPAALLAGGSTAAAPSRSEVAAGAVEGDDGRSRFVSAPGRIGDTSRRRDVMFVGDNWAGTATVVDVATREPIKTLNIVPDHAEELQEIYTAPDRLAFYLAVQQVIGEGHNQYVDDMFTTRDGRLLAVSRPSFSDVVWLNLATGRIVAEQQMDGYRTDHMGVSPDGRRLLVSDSTERAVHEYVMGGAGRARTGTRLRTFESGDTPHENQYSDDGRRIFHASIGRVYTPVDYPQVGPIDLGGVHDAVKADRWLEVVSERTFDVTRRWDMGQELAEAGYPGMSSAVRPLALSPDERTAYLQVSFLHGVVEFDLDARDPSGGGDYAVGDLEEPATGRVERVINLPVAEGVEDVPREQYVLDSAHHGIALSDDGRRLCVAGTMSDYAAVVGVRSGRPTVFSGQGRFLEDRTYSKPYWATTGEVDGHCWVSMSGSDLVTVIDYRTREVVAEVPVGEHPQRVRDGVLAPRVLRSWARGGASSEPDLTLLPISAEQQQAAEQWLADQIADILDGLGGLGQG